MNTAAECLMTVSCAGLPALHSDIICGFIGGPLSTSTVNNPPPPQRQGDSVWHGLTERERERESGLITSHYLPHYSPGHADPSDGIFTLSV